VGTAPFIAPEVRRKLPSSTKADIFSFVMTAVQMFSRATPLMYDSERQAEDNFGELQKVDRDAYDMLIRCVDFEASNRPDSDSLVETFSALIRNSKVVDPRRSPVSVDYSVVSEIESKLDSVSDEKLAHVIHPTKDVQMASMLTWLSEYCPDISQDNRVLFVNQIVQIVGATSVQHVKEIALRIGSHLTDMADLLDGVESSTPEEALPIVKWLRSLSITTADNEAIRISISDACIIANALIHEDNPLPPMPPGLLEQRILNRAQAKARSLSPVNFNPVVITHSVEKSGITSREASITSLATAFNSEGFSGKHSVGLQQSRGANTFLSSGAGTDKNSTIAPSRDPAGIHLT
jgi:serine/threonine protein kinase